MQNQAQAEDVRAVIHRFPAHLLRRHVCRRAHNRKGLGEILCKGGIRLRHRSALLGQPEVQDLDPPFPCDHHVPGLQIPMHDAGRVRCRQPARNLCSNLDGFANRQRSAFD